MQNLSSQKKSIREFVLKLGLFGKKNNLENILVVIFIYIITFPYYEPDFTIGLDSSYVWGLNHLFDTNYQFLKELVYPFGPLAFLKIPVVIGKNYQIYLLFFSLLKIWFTFFYIRTAHKYNPSNKIIPYFIVCILLFFFNIDYLIIGLIVLHGFEYLQKKKTYNILIINILATIGICIKSSIGVSGFSIITITFIIDLYQNKNLKISIKYLAASVFSILVSGLIVFTSFGLFFKYLIHIFKLAISYSSALAIFPENNWYLLSIFIASILLPAFLTKDKSTKVIFFILLPVLFAMWKHAMSRQDFTHSNILLVFVFMYWGMFFAISQINYKILAILAIVSITSFYSNMTNTWNFRPQKIEISGINNFENTILNFSKNKSKFYNLSIESLKPNKLPDSLLKIIDTNSIDSYPWELSYFAANPELRWKARTTLQGGSFARWLDSLNAIDFDRNNGPEFLIFHLVKDKYNGNLGSIDERYLLNDNPLSIANIFNFYDIKLKTQSFILFKKNDKDNFQKVSLDNSGIIKWDEWLELNSNNSDILRIKLISRQTLIGKIKSFLYKSEKYYIDYSLENGNVLTYRFIPENAVDGIWINPFIHDPNSSYTEPRVQKVKFRCTNKWFNKDEINYVLEKISVDSLQFRNSQTKDYACHLFQKTKQNIENIIFQQTIDFENINGDKYALNKEHKYSGSYSQSVPAGGFSYSFKINIDSLWNSIEPTIANCKVETNLKYLNFDTDANHVVSISNSNNNIWKGQKLNKQDTNKEWTHSFVSIELNREIHKDGVLAVYLWNNGKGNICIDDFSLIIKTLQTN